MVYGRLRAQYLIAMGEFNDAVTSLLQAFTSGLAVLRSIRHRRKESMVEVDPGLKKDELRLRKSLKKNRADVRNAYAQDLAKIGLSFSEGDGKLFLNVSTGFQNIIFYIGNCYLLYSLTPATVAKAQSSLTSILFRLNAGYVNIIDRFTRGESTRTDYRTLMKLSNASRGEAMKTFKQLSLRLSQTSPALSEKSKHERHSSSRKQKRKSAAALSSSIGASHRPIDRPKSTPESPRKRTVRGPKTSQALALRPKAREKTSKMLNFPNKQQQGLEARPRQRVQSVSNAGKTSVTMEKSLLSPTMPSFVRSNRISMMSFASDSTKIGEIPERKLPRPLVLNTEGENHLANTAFPLAPWTKPEKPKSRFMRLFRKSVIKNRQIT